jgi:hypothetical protein
MRLIVAPAWMKTNLHIDITYKVLANAHRNRELETHKFGHRSVDVSEQALRAYVRKHHRTTVH